MRQQQPKDQTVVVYRSKGEQIRDEALWSEGYLTPTIMGDIIVCVVALGILAIGYAKLRDWWRWRKRG